MCQIYIDYIDGRAFIRGLPYLIYSTYPAELSSFVNPTRLSFQIDKYPNLKITSVLLYNSLYIILIMYHKMSSILIEKLVRNELQYILLGISIVFYVLSHILIFSYRYIHIFIIYIIMYSISLSPPTSGGMGGGGVILMRNEKRRDSVGYVRQNVQYLNSH